VSVRRITNSIRRRAATSLRYQGEVRKSLVTLAWWKAMTRQFTWLEMERQGRCGEVSGESCAVGERCRSQSLHGTAAARSRSKR
jgi:hypothetical protein